MNMPHIQACAESDSKKAIELVGGPLCGLLKRWPSGETYQDFDYYAGTASCGYEGNGTAIYLQG